MELKDVVRKLVGPVRGVGETHEDAKRLENMKTMCLLIEDLLSDVETTYSDADSHQASVGSIGKVAKHFIDGLSKVNTGSNFSIWLDAEIQRLKEELPRGFATCESEAPLEGKLNTLLEVRDAFSCEITALRNLVEKQKMILNAVVASEFEGISCNSVNGVNWFDARDSVE